jgi:hypothetical protein
MPRNPMHCREHLLTERFLAQLVAKKLNLDLD